MGKLFIGYGKPLKHTPSVRQARICQKSNLPVGIPANLPAGRYSCYALVVLIWSTKFVNATMNDLEADFISYSVAVPQKSICLVWYIIREKSETNNGWIRGYTSSKVILSRVYAAVSAR